MLRRGLGRELRRGVETASTGRTRKVVGADTYKERWHDFAKCAFGVHGVQTKAGTSRQVLFNSKRHRPDVQKWFVHGRVTTDLCTVTSNCCADVWMVAQVAKVLKKGGKFVCISTGSEGTRTSYLDASFEVMYE